MRMLIAFAILLACSVPASAAQLDDGVEALCKRLLGSRCPGSLIIGIRAYIFGYPLLMVDVTKDVATNVKDATSTIGRAPINQFSNNGLPDERYKDIVLPSVSTPYSSAFLDLSKEPLVLHVPSVGEMCQLDGGPPCTPRFFLMQMLDGWTNVGGLDDECINNNGVAPPPGFCGLGSRYLTTPGDYLLVGADGWNRAPPAGIRQIIKFQTNIGWIAGRHLTTGTQQDFAQVSAIQQQYSIVPLSRYGRNYKPPQGRVNPRIDMTTSPRDQVAAMNAPQYFRKLADLMRDNPPSPDDAAIVAQMARIGLVPDRPFHFHSLDRSTQLALQLATIIGQRLIQESAQQISLTTTNWSMALDLGSWGTEYLERAAVAFSGLGANLFKDAVYAGVFKDGQNNDLVGDFKYQLRFEPGQFPPANPLAFWSVTLYNRPAETLYDNAIGRNALGLPAQEGHLPCPNADNSLTFYIQHDQPTNTAEDPNAVCNWLPAPAPGSQFILLLRMYWPGNSLFTPNNPWIPPAVTKK